MFVDGAFRLHHPYCIHDRSAEAILAILKRFAMDMGVPRAFSSDNGIEYTNRAFVEFCNNLEIRREVTTSYTPQHDSPVESVISRTFKAGHAARFGVPNIYPGIRLEKAKGFTDATATSL